ncbi:MAG: glycosyltransferase family 39 protein [Betaproteobacteria bacterium]|nr:glycosyltransferase family 39 protein [Betaproteobacteria bacterium]
MPMIASLGTIVLAYLYGRYLSSDAVGLLAALLLAVFPLDVVNASLLFPDTILGACTAFGVYLVMRSEKSKHWFAMSLVAGLVLGIAWLVKVEAILLLPVLLPCSG